MPEQVPPRRLLAWSGIAFVVAALYLAREVCIPLALALLLSFLLGPLVVRLRRLGVGRKTSVVLSVGGAVALVGLIAWLMASQVYDLAARLPEYQSNMQNKARSLSKPGGGIVGKASRVLHELSRDIGKSDDGKVSNAPSAKPVPVEVHQPDPTAFQVVRNLVTPLAQPLVTAGIVIVFVIFMLLNREDLRDRLIRLIGAGRLNITTQALDDAAHRISRFLLAQLLVNLCYGIPIAIGLFFVRVPNPLLWGLMATLLRFIPYLGPWLAASMPCALAFAVDPGWGMLFGTLGIFVGMELITYNLLEPWIYGSSTGISPIAILGAAIFWAWLWGPIGLLLSTPLTVCLVVIGRYVPRLQFLSVLLGDEPVLTPEARFYQRLLAMNYDEAVDLAEHYAMEKSIPELYEHVFIPALLLVEADRHHGTLDPDRERFVFEITRELIQDLPERIASMKAKEAGAEPVHPQQPAHSEEPIVLCLAASDEADELAALMLAQLLAKRGVAAKVVGASALAAERLEAVHQEQVRTVCISALPPGAVAPARYLCKKLQTELRDLRIVVGVWQNNPDVSQLQQRIGPNLAHAVVTTLSQAVEHIAPAGSPDPKKSAEGVGWTTPVGKNRQQTAATHA